MIKKIFKFVWDSFVFTSFVYGLVLIVKLPLDFWKDHFETKRRKAEA